MLTLILETLLNLILWNLLGFIVLLIIPYTKEADDLGEIFNPKEIYDNTTVNIFGCIMLTILFNILCPVMTIGYWLWWLCTVGRR